MELLLSFTVLGAIALLAAISPGPDFVVVSKNSIAHSRAAGIWTAIGVGCALLIHVSYTIIGIGLVISQSILLFSIIKVVGAMYLIWLGISLLRSSGTHALSESEVGQTSISWISALREGFLTNALNPKATVFFVSIFSQFVSPKLPIVVQAAYGIEVALIVALWFVTLAVLLTMPAVRSGIGKAQSHVMKIMGVVLVGLGIKVAFSRM
ncbi:LysE family transporter [Candidatus Kaiserbacteria bacterium]|nr:LysE family transporter [Candidatus Kaiserbacteria bacterium]